MSGIQAEVSVLIAPIQASGGCALNTEPFQFKAISDVNGHFVIDGLPANIHAGVTIASDKWDCIGAMAGTSSNTPAVKRGWVRTTEYFAGPARIKLFPKCELNGTVVDSEGVPVAGVHIGFQHEAVTDEDGKFTIHRLDPSAWDVDELKDYEEGVQVDPPNDSRFLRTYISLDREQLSTKTIKPVVLQGTWVSGRILSAESKQPLVGIEIRAENQMGNARSVSDADGRFRFPLQPGSKTLRFAPLWMSDEERQYFHDNPKSRAVRQIDIVDSEPVDVGTILIDVDTAAAKPVTIRVVQAGKTVSDCRVVLGQSRQTERRPESQLVQASLVRGDSVDRHLLTDAQGIAVIRPAMGWSITGSDPRAAQRNPPQNFAANKILVSYPSASPRYFASLDIPHDIPADLVELQLAEGAQYSGRVLINGSPLVGVDLSLGAWPGVAPALLSMVGNQG